MSEASLRQHVDTLLKDLLLPENRLRLETFRFRGSTNRVYKIPVEEAGKGEFIILKLLPPRSAYWRKRIKHFFRNLMYGERVVSLGNRRVQLEIARSREWQEAGLCVPEAIETSIPDIRVFRGLPYPTLYTLLGNQNVSDGKKLEALAAVVQSLSYQHKKAAEKGHAGLVHGDPGPWNIMFDLETMTTVWFDLEHPDVYPGMTLEDVMVRGMRIFVYGVLDQMGHASDRFFTILAENYQVDSVLRRLVESMEHGHGTPAIRLMGMLGMRKGSEERRRQIATQLSQALHLRDLASTSRNILQGTFE